MLERRGWVPAVSEDFVQEMAGRIARSSVAEIGAELDRLVIENHGIHDRDCINLNTASNVMNP